MKKNQRVWVLITEQSISYWPVAYVARGVVKQANISPPHHGSKYYCEVEIIRPKKAGKFTNQFLKKNVLASSKKSNYKILEQRAKKFIESVIKKRRKLTAEIEKEYSKLLKG